MNTMGKVAGSLMLLLAGCGSDRPAAGGGGPSPSPLQAPSGRALRGGGRFANDLGPETLDVSAYPEALRRGYALTVDRCGKCHSVARVFHSAYVEAERDDLARLKAAQPELFQAPLVWRVEPQVWKRYAKRMAMKAGSGLTPKEAETIHAFLAEDSRRRKTGERAAAWRTHREGLLREYQQRFPEAYDILYGDRVHD